MIQLYARMFFANITLKWHLFFMYIENNISTSMSICPFVTVIRYPYPLPLSIIPPAQKIALFQSFLSLQAYSLSPPWRGCKVGIF